LSDEPNQISVKPIGIVRNEVKSPTPPGYNWDKIVSEVVIEEALSPALDRLEEFSHIIVLFWMHLSKRQTSARVHPQGRVDLPLVGILATRSPHRPNPIGKATVRLLERHDNVLVVEGLDAIDGTPVIDIKPYIPKGDAPADAKVPKWITRL
jgi:tRNA-Thr(GGU) m(6)t(6)A37 methyltransferase TsaA